MWRQKAIARLGRTFSPRQVREFVRLADIVSLFPNSESVFRRISKAKEDEAVFDYLAEIRFGLTFASLEFELKFEPCGEKGPDLLVSRDGQSAYVEVRRIRTSQVEPTLPFLDLMDESSKATLAEYGDFERSVKEIEDELYSQTGAKRIPPGLLFCIFGWDWLLGGGQKLHCGVLKQLAEPFARWVSDLKGARFSLENFATSGTLSTS